MEMTMNSEPRTAGSTPWKPDLATAATWGVLAGLSAVAVLFYLRRLTPEAFATVSRSSAALAMGQGRQALVVLAVLWQLGLSMGHRAGLRSAGMEAWAGAPRSDAMGAMGPWNAFPLGGRAAVAI